MIPASVDTRIAQIVEACIHSTAQERPSFRDLQVQIERCSDLRGGDDAAADGNTLRHRRRVGPEQSMELERAIALLLQDVLGSRDVAELQDFLKSKLALGIKKK